MIGRAGRGEVQRGGENNVHVIPDVQLHIVDAPIGASEGAT